MHISASLLHSLVAPSSQGDYDFEETPRYLVALLLNVIPQIPDSQRCLSKPPLHPDPGKCNHPRLPDPSVQLVQPLSPVICDFSCRLLPLGGICHHPLIVYKVTCNITTKAVYIGSTQQHFKKCTGGHFQDLKKMVERNLPSDSYACHFTSLLLGATQGPTQGMQRNGITCSAIYNCKEILSPSSSSHSGRTPTNSV
jgi:hypothetical protein